MRIMRRLWKRSRNKTDTKEKTSHGKPWLFSCEKKCHKCDARRRVFSRIFKSREAQPFQPSSGGEPPWTVPGAQKGRVMDGAILRKKFSLFPLSSSLFPDIPNASKRNKNGSAFEIFVLNFSISHIKKFDNKTGGDFGKFLTNWRVKR